MLLATIKLVTKVINPATPTREGLSYVNSRGYSSVLTLSQYNLKQKFLTNIKIYRTGLIKDPVHDYETLKLFSELETFILNKDQEKAIQCVEKFIANKDGIYNADYGKAKQQLGDILYSHRKFLKITPLSILDKMGFKKDELIEKGILETTLLKTKTCVSSTVFEILVMEALPKKYAEIKKVHYCQDGAVKIKCINFTGQENYDYVIEFEDQNKELIRIAFDSKVQKFDTCLDNLNARGLNYQVLTVGNISDSEIMRSSAYINSVSKIKKNPYGSFVEKTNIVLDCETSFCDPEDYMSSNVATTMFINTDDITKIL